VPLRDRLPRFRWRSLPVALRSGLHRFGWRNLPVSPRARLIRFIGEAVALLIIVSVVWYFIDPPYNRLLVEITDRLSTLRIALGDGTSVIYIYFDTPLGEGSIGIKGAGFHFGLILLPVLIAVTPGLKLLRRLKFIAIALGVMFVIHIITILIFALIIGTSADPAQFSTNPWVIFLVTIGTQLFPAVIWVILCFKYWFPHAEAVGKKKKR